MPDGMAINDQGQICISARRFKGGATGKVNGLWNNLEQRTGDRNDRNQPDLTRPYGRLVPFDAVALNGQVVHALQYTRKIQRKRQKRRNSKSKLQFTLINVLVR